MTAIAGIVSGILSGKRSGLESGINPIGNILPVAAFSSVVTNLSVAFTDGSTDADGSVVAWLWDFGDGHTSTSQSPTNVYASGGAVTVSLTVTDDKGGVSAPITHSVTPHAAPVAAFSSVTTLLSVAFTNTSTADTASGATIVSYDWDYGDGTTHGTTASPTHAYTTNGSKTVTLTVTDSFGSTNAVNHAVTPDITRDGVSSLRRVALSAADFTAIGVTAPSSLYLLQEASGNAADTIGSITLTTSGSPTYQNTITNWTRKGVKFTEVASQGLIAAAASGPNPATGSTAWGCYFQINATPGGNREFMGLQGANGCKVLVLANGKLRLTCVGVSVDSTSTSFTDGLVHFCILVYNKTASSVKAFTDLETVTGTYNSGSTDNNKGFGYLGTTNIPGTVLWGFAASGATAEGYGAATLTALGW